jgi:hypothetical protein
MRANNNFKIEKGIPVPEIPHRYKYPWRLMEVGDSFAMTISPNETKRWRSNLASSAAHLKDRQFVFQVRDENHTLVIRTWRIK